VRSMLVTSHPAIAMGGCQPKFLQKPENGELFGTSACCQKRRRLRVAKSTTALFPIMWVASRLAEVLSAICLRFCRRVRSHASTCTLWARFKPANALSTEEGVRLAR